MNKVTTHRFWPGRSTSHMIARSMQSMRPVFTCTLMVFALVLATSCATGKPTEQEIQNASTNVDYGDYSSATLTAKAWEAWNDKDYPKVFAYTKKCVELHGEAGKKMNAEMTAFEPSSTAAEKWALNDVGTCLFIMGEAYAKLEQYPEAVQAYRTLAQDYQYAQCWDPKGWFWRPAEQAAAKAEYYENLP